MPGLVTFQDWWMRWAQQVGTLGASGDMKISLFKNDHTPSPTDTLADYVEADFHGYSAQQLDNWNSPSLVGNTAQITHPTVTWTKTAGSPTGLVFGYYVWSDSIGEFWWAERNPFGSVNMSTNGQVYVVNPKIYNGPATA